MFAADSARRACSLGWGWGWGVLLGGSLEGVGFGAGCSCDLSLGLVGETCCWRMVTGGSSLACFLGDSTPFPGGALRGCTRQVQAAAPRGARDVGGMPRRGVGQGGLHSRTAE